MRRIGKIVGVLCGVAFAGLLLFMIVSLVQGTPDIDYGKIGVVLFVLAVGAERLSRL